MERPLLGILAFDIGAWVDWFIAYATWMQGIVTIAALCATIWFSHQQVINQRAHEKEEKENEKHLKQIKNIARVLIFLGGLQHSLKQISAIFVKEGLPEEQMRSALRLPIRNLEENIELVKKAVLLDYPCPQLIMELSKSISESTNAVEAITVAIQRGNPVNRDPGPFDKTATLVLGSVEKISEYQDEFVTNRKHRWPKKEDTPEADASKKETVSE